MKIRFGLPPTASTESQGLAVRYAAAKRRVPRLRWYLLVMLVSAPLLFFVVRFVSEYVWDTAPAFVVMEQATLKAGVAGYVDALVPQGTTVPEGTRLASVQRVSEARLEPEAQVASMRAAKLDLRAPVKRVALAQAALALAQEQRGGRERQRKLVHELVDQGAATAGERAAADAQWTAARSDEIRAQSDLLAATETLQRLRSEQARAEIITPTPPTARASVEGPLAPFDGVVIRTLVARHEWVSAESDIAVLQSLAEPLVRAYLQPSEARHARPGEHASLHFLDGVNISATVLRVEAEAALIPSDRIGPLAPRNRAVVVLLKPENPLPAPYRLNSLPLDVRFSRW